MVTALALLFLPAVLTMPLHRLPRLPLELSKGRQWGHVAEA